MATVKKLTSVSLVIDNELRRYMERGITITMREPEFTRIVNWAIIDDTNYTWKSMHCRTTRRDAYGDFELIFPVMHSAIYKDLRPIGSCRPDGSARTCTISFQKIQFLGHGEVWFGLEMWPA